MINVKGESFETAEQFYREYWRRFSESAAGKHSVIGKPRRSGCEWVSWSARSGYEYACVISRPAKYIRVRILLMDDLDKSKYFKLLPYRDEVDGKFPDLYWRRRPGAVESYIDYSKLGSDPNDLVKWNEQHDWMIEHAIKLVEAFDPIIKSLP